MSPNQRQFKVLARHARDEEYHEWITLGAYVYRDGIGRKAKFSYRRWLVWRCNNLDCPAQAIVSAEAIEHIVEGWLDG